MSSHRLSGENNRVEKNNLGRGGIFVLSLMALGIVCGDIGTSPLYTVNQIFFGFGKVAVTPAHVLGAIGLVIWTLTIVISIKYVIYALRADNDGQGGVFALFGQIKVKHRLALRVITGIFILAAGLLLGDGLITPAISVLSAVEGLKVATNVFEPFIVPITIVILVALFAVQKKGTTKIGALFGPLVLVWFAAITVIGAREIYQTPAILQAINPRYAAMFLRTLNFRAILLVLGAVMLAVTGGEALYADMGHFGKKAIRRGWFFVAYPALLLTYLGQGAYLLSGRPVAGGNVFFSLVPAWGIYPMVIIATVATVIASQALISGAFSLAAQAMALGLFPRLKITHTHERHEGQIYVPLINAGLFIGCITLVLLFRSSRGLAAAYGLAESGVMLATSLGLMVVAVQRWGWNRWRAAVWFGLFAVVDGIFLVANSLKFWEGGFIPLAVGALLFVIMTTWRWGRQKTAEAFTACHSMTVKDLIDEMRRLPLIDRSMIIMDPRSIRSLGDKVPAVLQFFWERYQVLAKHILFVTVAVSSEHAYCRGDRFSVKKFSGLPDGASIADVTINFGFMERPLVEPILDKLAASPLGVMDERSKWIVQVGLERLIPSTLTPRHHRLRLRLFALLRQNAQPTHYYYGLGNDVRLSVEVMPVKVE